MVRKVNLSSIGDCVALTEKNEDSYHRAVLPLKARLTTESILMKAVGQWVKTPASSVTIRYEPGN